MISEYTLPQLEYYRTFCNFTPEEKKLFDLRAAGCTLDECCEEFGWYDVSRVKRLSRKVNNKMIRVVTAVDMDKWIRENYS